MADALTMTAVAKRYGERVALDGVDLAVPTGSVFGLVGRNGAGKSTLIKCALGLIRPTAGEISVLGDPPRALADATKARIGYAPQQPALYPWMRVDQLVSYTAAYYPRWDDALVERLLLDWSVDRRARIASLSPGNAQQLAIIVALGHRPDLLVLDEPAAALDPAARRRFLAAVLEVALDGGRTVLFSTHLIADLERVADRIAVLRRGRVAYAGELGALKDEVKRLRVDGAVPDRVPVEILSRRGEAGAAQLTVRGDAAAASRALVAAGATVAIDDLGLEDIFVELTA